MSQTGSIAKDLDRLTLAALFAALFVGACGAATPATQSASNETAISQSDAAGQKQPTAASAAPTQSVLTVPAECARQTDDGYCLPEERFVRKLCDGVYADVALVMFRQGTPWTRAYLTRKTESWNASGGASVQGEMAFDEEVLVLRERKSKDGGIQVSGAMGSYDVLRWNGSCASLMAEELTLRVPPKLLHSRVEWNWLSSPMQEALRADGTITDTYRARRNECKGVSIGDVSKKCEQLDNKLVAEIVSYVRSGGTLATPKFP